MLITYYCSCYYSQNIAKFACVHIHTQCINKKYGRKTAQHVIMSRILFIYLFVIYN